MNSKLSIFLVLLAYSSLSAQDRGMEVIKSGNQEKGQYRKVALIIGNGNYKFSPLRNPVTDAKDMAQALAGFGFEVI